MALISPFRGIFYEIEKVKDLSKVVAPPYDIIGPEEQKFFYQLHPYNIIRVVLNREEGEEKYQKASSYFKKWLKEGILWKDPEPGFYPYEQRYEGEEKEYKRLGFVALLKLEDFSLGRVFPHERTFLSPRRDRLNLLRACRANFSPIFCLYSDPEKKSREVLKKQKILFSFQDREKVRHTLGKIKEKEQIRSLKAILKDKKIFIADGHHRYLTALEYLKERKNSGGKRWIMAYFLNMEEEGVTIFPVHRVLKNVGEEEVKKLKGEISRFFELEKKGCLSQKEIRGKGVLGMLVEDSFYLLNLKEEIKKNLTLKEALGSELVNNFIVGEIFKTQPRIEFVKEMEKAIEMVKKGEGKIAFFLPPVKIEDLKEISLSGEVMPQKSTYFYPKLPSGVIMRSLDD